MLEKRERSAAPVGKTSVPVRPGLSRLRPSKGPTQRLAPLSNVQTRRSARNLTLSRASGTSQGPRILFIDIETAPIEAFVWGLFDQNVGLEQIKAEWSILSVAWSWLDESNHVHQIDTSSRGARRVRDDRKVLEHVWRLLDAADIVVAHNGDRFDVPKINARLVERGFGPYSPIRVVDTLRVARGRFGFTSNKQAWITKHLTPSAQKSAHKKFPGIELWKACLADKAEAWAEMRRYNIRDVVGLRAMYLKLRPWISGHPNVAVYDPSADPQCPKCGSTDLKRNGSSCTQVGQYARYFCRACKGFSRGRLLLNSRSKRASLLSN